MIVAVLLQCVLFNLVLSVSQHPVLIVVSYDAFRYNFFAKGLTPHMSSLRKEGTYAEYLENVFPTKTFPNHHSIATGIYPETHGVVDNLFYDPKLHKTVKISAEMYNYNENVLPIWTVNELAGKDRYSGIMMWPGGRYPYKNITPTYVKPWEITYDWFKRVDEIIAWIMDPKKPANLVMLYIAEPDTHGHAFGPDSSQVAELIRKLDNLTAYLDKKLAENKLKDKVNVIHLSDHGMVSVNPSNFIDLRVYLQNGTYEMVGSSPILHVLPKKGKEEEVYNKLQLASKKNGHFKIYKKSETLPRWHYKDNDRIGPIIALAEVGFAFQDMYDSVNFYKQKYNLTVTNSSTFGVHGYDYTVPDMHPFFMARGPKIQKNKVVGQFNVLDLMNLFCEIIEVSPPKNNGNSAIVPKILISKSQTGNLSTIITAVAAILTALLIVVICAVGVTLAAIKRQQTITTTAALNKRFQQNFTHSSIEAQHLLDAEEA